MGQGGRQNQKKRKKLIPQERARRAIEIVYRIEKHLRLTTYMHESNAILCYSDQISGQIPKSQAAQPFNILQASQYQLELVRLTAIWDKPGQDRQSFPRVAELIQDDVRKNTLADEVFELFVRNALSKREAKYNRSLNDMRRSLVEALGIIDRLMNGENEEHSRLQAIRSFRDWNIAHYINGSESPMKGTALGSAKYGDEEWLLERSIEVLTLLAHGTNGLKLNWEAVCSIGRSNAKGFWERITYDPSPGKGS